MNAIDPRSVVTKQEAEFAAEYLVDLNGTQALLRIRPGITKASAAVQASRLLRRDRVVKLIRHLQAERARRAEIRADEVLVKLWRIATADPRELIRIRVLACESCYREMDLPSRPNEPDPECGSCFGDGKPKCVLGDTRSLSPEAAALYAGVRPTRWGLQVLLHNQVKALYLVGQHLGMWGSSQLAGHSPAGSGDPLQALLDEIADRHQPLEPVAAPSTAPASQRTWRAVLAGAKSTKAKRS